MIQVVFILGRPGSGKSTTYKYLTRGLEEQGWYVTTIKGFPFLQALSEEPAYSSWFTYDPRYYGGFLVTNDQAFTYIYEQMGYQTSLLSRKYQYDEERHLLFIQLSQGTYEDILLDHYEPTIFQQALVLHLAIPYELCLQRIEARKAGKGDPDDTHVPQEQFLIRHCGKEQLPSPRVIAPERFITLNNTGPIEGLYRQLDQVIARLEAIGRESEVHT